MEEGERQDIEGENKEGIKRINQITLYCITSQFRIVLLFFAASLFVADGVASDRTSFG